MLIVMTSQAQILKKTVSEDLPKFLGITEGDSVDLVLPDFLGGIREKDRMEAFDFIYPGTVYSNRDTQAAFLITNLLNQVINSENIHLKDASSFDFNKTNSKVIFLFGSKSNVVSQKFLKKHL